MSAPDIHPVRSRADLKAFLALPWRIYADDPCWVPPIRSSLAHLLDPARHPFWHHARRELFLVRRQGLPVGRIVVLADDHHNRAHGSRDAAWGFFECERDQEAAAALFAAAARWARDEGMTLLRGPLNPSVNYEAGLLIQGFDRPPTLGFTYNPPYYHGLIVGAGMRKEKDLLAFRFGDDFTPPAWAADVIARLVAKGEFRIRTADKHCLADELRLINAIYNRCWAGNWGHVPMTEAEIAAACREVIHFVDPDLIAFIYHGDEPVGVSLVLPDVNPILRRLDGRGGLWALAFLRLYRREVVNLRGYILGVTEEYRRLGVPMVALDHLLRLLPAKPRYRAMELGWTLEDNDEINRIYEEARALPSRRFRIYAQRLDEAAVPPSGSEASSCT